MKKYQNTTNTTSITEEQKIKLLELCEDLLDNSDLILLCNKVLLPAFVSKYDDGLMASKEDLVNEMEQSMEHPIDFLYDEYQIINHEDDTII